MPKNDLVWYANPEIMNMPHLEQAHLGNKVTLQVWYEPSQNVWSYQVWGIDAKFLTGSASTMAEAKENIADNVVEFAEQLLDNIRPTPKTKELRLVWVEVQDSGYKGMRKAKVIGEFYMYVYIVADNKWMFDFSFADFYGWDGCFERYDTPEEAQLAAENNLKLFAKRINSIMGDENADD